MKSKVNLIAFLKSKVNLFVFALGLAAFSAGIYLIYPPAMLISAGAIFMAISIFGEGKKQ